MNMNNGSRDVKAGAVKSATTITVSVESIDLLFEYWRDQTSELDWNCPFVLPGWLKAWWESFGKRRKPYICAVRQGGALIGIAPLIVDEDRACLMGDSNLSDYVDFIVARGRDKQFFRTLFDHLRQVCITRLDMGRVRADSNVISELKAQAVTLGYEIRCEPADPVYKMALPGTWEEYLGLLPGKERHEIRRKRRRLYEAGHITFQCFEKKEEIREAINIFIRLFRLNRMEKALFMTDTMASFFRSLAEAMAEAGLLKLFLLSVNNVPAAAALCFDYRSTVYLYNSSYDHHFSRLSAGLLCKVFSIRDSIERERKTFDFLKGDEAYKRRLGGKPARLYRCQIMLK